MNQGLLNEEEQLLKNTVADFPTKCCLRERLPMTSLENSHGTMWPKLGS
ncbi:MAG: hypothetical protein CM1200mP3_10780 [Chloroflexota bacterium]|nr:MAG: hypothetical protein CM1200mP3_10780 [Chloroflexota bacterium]